ATSHTISQSDGVSARFLRGCRCAVRCSGAPLSIGSKSVGEVASPSDRQSVLVSGSESSGGSQKVMPLPTLDRQLSNSLATGRNTSSVELFVLRKYRRRLFRFRLIRSSRQALI